MSEMNIQDIMDYLPHRYPFLLVDKVLKVEVGKAITAIKNVTINEPFFMGHFPLKPIMPGVLIVEALAQTAAILAYKSTEQPLDKMLCYLGAVDNTRFKKIVIPGDQLILNISVLKKRNVVWKFYGKASVNNEVVCTSEITCSEGKI